MKIVPFVPASLESDESELLESDDSLESDESELLESEESLLDESVLESEESLLDESELLDSEDSLEFEGSLLQESEESLLEKSELLVESELLELIQAWLDSSKESCGGEKAPFFTQPSDLRKFGVILAVLGRLVNVRLANFRSKHRRLGFTIRRGLVRRDPR